MIKENQGQEPENEKETGSQWQPEGDAANVDNSERDAMLEQRRSRQPGRSGGGSKKILAATVILAAGAGIFLILSGPSSIFSLFAEKKGEPGKTETSQVGLEVKDVNQPKFNLDFKPVLAQDSEADQLKTQLKELEQKLAEIGQSPGDGGITQKKIEEMLKAHSKQLEEKMAKDRLALKEENLRLQEEAKALQEEARKREEAEKLEDEESKKLEEQSNLQRDSKQLVVDEAPTDALTTAGTGNVTSGSGQNEEFLALAADAGFETSVAKPLSNPSRTVVQGTIISGVLETAINTELPGNIRAQVTEPVFSYDGTYVMMPSGTVLIGTFNPEINLEQKRVLIAWNRAITPDGQSIAIGGTGADLLGRSGTAGNVNNRYAKKLGAAVLISAISIAPDLIASRLAPAQSTQTSDQPSVSLNLGGGSSGGSSAAQSLGGATSEQAAGIFEQYLSLPPLIRIPQGEEIRVFVNRDLVFR